MTNNKPKFKETELGPIPEDWVVLKFDDIAELNKDSYNPKTGDNLPYLGLEHINQQSLSINSIGSSDDVSSNKYKFTAGDILFGKLRPYFKKIYQPKFDGICSTDIWVIRAKNTTDQNWLHWFVTNQDFVNMASSGSGGTKMPRADWAQVAISEWSVPPITEQQKIAGVLGALDEKIEVLRKMNKTLEEIGQAVFKKWFASPNNAPLVELGKKVKIVKGKNVTKDTVRDGNIPVVAGGMNPSCYHDTANTIAPVVTISASGANAGFVRLYHDDVWASDCSFIDKSVTPYVYFYYLYLTDNIENINNLKRGSAQPHVYPKDLMELKIPDFDEKLIKKFTEIVSPIFVCISDNTKQVKTLSQIRDSLLPRLMSGKLRVG